jgi:hypothetical protein
MQTVRVRPAPVVLVVSDSPGFLRRCGDVAIQVQSVVVEASEQSFSTLATQTRALAVVMLEATFGQNPDHFRALAKEAGLRLVTVPDETIAQSDLETRLLSAITEAERANRERRR